MKTAIRVEQKKKTPKKVRRHFSEREKLDRHLRRNLKPVSKTPSGHVFYDYDEVAALDISFPKKK